MKNILNWNDEHKGHVVPAHATMAWGRRNITLQNLHFGIKWAGKPVLFPGRLISRDGSSLPTGQDSDCSQR